MKAVTGEYSFMFYNTENFFDSEDDSLTTDDEYTAEAGRRWNSGRMYTKAERLGKVILAAGKWNPPVFAGLCEIENLHVLELLTNMEPLKKYQYKIIQKDSPDRRGIDVAFIYRPDLFKPIEYQAIEINDSTDCSFRTRDILRVSGIFNRCDTLHVFVNHWPSRFGGVMETDRLRKLAAETLRKSVVELQMKFPDAKVICMGDFNDSPADESIVSILDAKKVNHPSIEGELVNLSADWINDPIQTIKSQYTWEVFDQLIVSDYFLEKNDYCESPKAEIFKAEFLLEPDLKYGGVKPKRTYVGFRYQEGFSDHLPVVLRIRSLNH
jgi:hypothetical protein